MFILYFSQFYHISVRDQELFQQANEAGAELNTLLMCCLFKECLQSFLHIHISDVQDIGVVHLVITPLFCACLDIYFREKNFGNMFFRSPLDSRIHHFDKSKHFFIFSERMGGGLTFKIILYMLYLLGLWNCVILKFDYCKQNAF